MPINEIQLVEQHLLKMIKNLVKQKENIYIPQEHLNKSMFEKNKKRKLFNQLQSLLTVYRIYLI